MCFVVTCWERAELLALVCGVFCEFVTFPLVSWVRCGTWLYRFLIFATLLLSCKPIIYVSWSTSELRVRLAPLNRFKPSSKIFYWPFQGGTSFVDILCFCSVLCLLCFVRVCLYVLCGHLLGKGWTLGSRLWCLLWVCHFPIGILGQVWYLIVSIPDLCNLITSLYFWRICLSRLFNHVATDQLHFSYSVQCWTLALLIKRCSNDDYFPQICWSPIVYTIICIRVLMGWMISGFWPYFSSISKFYGQITQLCTAKFTDHLFLHLQFANHWLLANI